MPVVHRRNKDLLCIPPVRQVHRVLHATPYIAKRAVPEVPHDAVREVARVIGCHVIQVGIPVRFHHPCIRFLGNRRQGIGYLPPGTFQDRDVFSSIFFNGPVFRVPDGIELV